MTITPGVGGRLGDMSPFPPTQTLEPLRMVGLCHQTVERSTND